jgi:hypothetical protein
VIEPPSGPEAWLQAPCAAHPGNPAARVCERCGDFMCQLCTTMAEGRAYCPQCFALLHQRGALHLARSTFPLPSLCLTLGIASLALSLCGVLCFLSIPLALVGIGVGTRALREHREHPDLPDRRHTTAGLWLSGAGLLASLGWLGVIVLRWIR